MELGAAAADCCGAEADACDEIAGEPEDAAAAAALAATGTLTGGSGRRCWRGPLLRRGCRNGRLGFRFGLRLRCGLGFGDRSALEEVVSQGSFEIGYELAHDLGLGHAEGSGCGVADRLKFRLERRSAVAESTEACSNDGSASCETVAGRKLSPREDSRSETNSWRTPRAGATEGSAAGGSAAAGSA